VAAESPPALLSYPLAIFHHHSGQRVSLRSLATFSWVAVEPPLKCLSPEAASKPAEPTMQHRATLDPRSSIHLVVIVGHRLVSHHYSGPDHHHHASYYS